MANQISVVQTMFLFQNKVIKRVTLWTLFYIFIFRLSFHFGINTNWCIKSDCFFIYVLNLLLVYIWLCKMFFKLSKLVSESQYNKFTTLWLNSLLSNFLKIFFDICREHKIKVPFGKTLNISEVIACSWSLTKAIFVSQSSK